MCDSPKVESLRGDEMSQGPVVIMAQSLPGFEVGPCSSDISTGGEAMLSVLSAGRGRSARGRGGRKRASSPTSKQRRSEPLPRSPVCPQALTLDR